MLPRQLFPWATYLCTRVCTQRQSWLKPDPVVNQVIEYCSARAAQMYGIWIHEVTAMSNHMHQVVTDPFCNLPRYLHWVHVHVAKCLNRYRGRCENLWNNDETNVVHLVQDGDVLDKIAYSIVNPVAAGQVTVHSDWLGVCTGAKAFGTSKTIERPDLYFSDRGRVPKTVELKVVPPRRYERTPGEYSRLVQSVVEERERQLNEDANREGRKLDGATRLAQMKPSDAPRTPRPRNRIKPRIACKDPVVRRERATALRLFYLMYRVDWGEYRAGNRDVTFPPGSYSMCVVHGMPCKPAPFGVSWLPAENAQPPRPPP